MNSGIYFSPASKRAHTPKFSARSIANRVCRIAYRLGPGVSVAIVRSILSKPSKAAFRGLLPGDFERQTLPTDSGDLQMYSLGTGPVVLFAHGWSGNASQFEPLMREISKRGYKTVAFDHYGHGHSGGFDSNYFLFIKAVTNIREFLEKNHEPVAAVIGHSIGGSASLQAFTNTGVPQLLISPAICVHELFRERVLSAGVPNSLFEQVVRAMSADSPIGSAAIDETVLLNNFASKVKLVHSTRDRVIPSSRSLSLLSTHPDLDLDVGAYGGHSSILKTDYIKRLSSQWLSEKLAS